MPTHRRPQRRSSHGALSSAPGRPPHRRAARATAISKWRLLRNRGDTPAFAQRLCPLKRVRIQVKVDRKRTGDQTPAGSRSSRTFAERKRLHAKAGGDASVVPTLSPRLAQRRGEIGCLREKKSEFRASLGKSVACFRQPIGRNPRDRPM